MARSPIQFQPGLSLPACLKQYGTESRCQPPSSYAQQAIAPGRPGHHRGLTGC